MKPMSERVVRVLTVFGFLALLAHSGGLAAGADWPNWRGPTHDGISTETGWTTNWPAGGPKVLWKASLGVGFSSFTVADGRVYTMGNLKKTTDVVWCFDAETGEVVWKHTYACPLTPKYYEGGPGATPTVDDGKVYTLSKHGHAFCFDAATGKILWSRKFNMTTPTWHFAGSARIMGEKVIFNVGTRGVALNKATGEPIWQTGSKPSGYATPVIFRVGDRQLLAMFGEKDVAAVDPGDGKTLWQVPWVNKHQVNAADPIISGGKMFISSGYNKGCALLKVDGPKGKILWENRNMRNHFNSCVLWKGSLYGFDESTLKCLDFETGQEKWANKNLGKGSLMLADGKLIVLSERGKLIVAEPSPKAFKPIASAQVLEGRIKCWTTPVLANGRIYARSVYLRTNRSDMVCLDVKPK